jgi:hypothetical protein
MHDLTWLYCFLDNGYSDFECASRDVSPSSSSNPAWWWSTLAAPPVPGADGAD